MEFVTRQRAAPLINLSALIDIAFILVIFVVLAASFHRIRTLDVALPSAEATHKADPKALVLTVRAEGPIDIQGKLVAPDDVKRTLAAMTSEFDSVLIVADRTASVQRAVKLLSDAQAAGFSSVGIALENKEDKHKETRP